MDLKDLKMVISQCFLQPGKLDEGAKARHGFALGTERCHCHISDSQDIHPTNSNTIIFMDASGFTRVPNEFD